MKKLVFFSAMAVSAALFAGTPKQMLTVRVASLDDISAAANELGKMVEQPALAAMASGQLRSMVQAGMPEFRSGAPGAFVVYVSEPEFSAAVAKLDFDSKTSEKQFMSSLAPLVSFAAAVPCEKMPAEFEKDTFDAQKALVEFPSGRYALVAKSIDGAGDKAVLDFAMKDRGIAKALAAKRPGEIVSVRFGRPACKAFADIIAKAMDKAIAEMSKDGFKGCPAEIKPHVQKLLDAYFGMARAYAARLSDTASFEISAGVHPGDRGGVTLAFDQRYVKGSNAFAITAGQYPDARELAARLPGKAQLYLADTMTCNPKVLAANGIDIDAFSKAFIVTCRAVLDSDDAKKELPPDMRAELLNIVDVIGSAAGKNLATGEFALAAGVKPSKRIWFKSVCGVSDPSSVIQTLCAPLNKSIAKIANIAAERNVAAEETLPDGATALKFDFDAIFAAIAEQCPECKDAGEVRKVLDMLFGRSVAAVSGVEGNLATTVIAGSGEKLPAPAGKRYGAIVPRSVKGVVSVARLSIAEFALPFVKKYVAENKDFAANTVAADILKSIPASTGGITMWESVRPGFDRTEIRISASEIKAIAKFVYFFQTLDAGGAPAAAGDDDDDEDDDD